MRSHTEMQCNVGLQWQIIPRSRCKNPKKTEARKEAKVRENANQETEKEKEKKKKRTPLLQFPAFSSRSSRADVNGKSEQPHTQT